MKNKIVSIPREILILLALSVVLNIIRVSVFHSYYFLYLLWNILLAILPFIISSALFYYASSNKAPKYLLIIGGVLWLLLIPNAPYIVTDLIHLNRGRTVILLYDTFLLFSSAWVGLLLGMYSMLHIEKIIRLKFTNRTTALFMALITLIISFGVYLGRFLRFNSWDVFSSTSFLFKNLWSIIKTPSDYVDAYLFTGLSFVFIYISYNAWKQSK